jgi:ATP:corrinoid adenosyltransferase
LLKTNIYLFFSAVFFSITLKGNGMLSQGMIHLYIGNGKGKTTAAAGLAVRALGAGLKVFFVQFLKNTVTGEKNILEKFTGKLYFFRPNQRHPLFLWKMTEKQLAETQEDLQIENTSKPEIGMLLAELNHYSNGRFGIYNQLAVFLD